MTGHLAASCFVQKSRPRRQPSWWAGVSPEHYSVHRSSEAVAPSEAEVGRVVDAPVHVVVAVVRPSPVAVSLPKVAEDCSFLGLASSGPAPFSVVAPMGGLPSSPRFLDGGQVPVPGMVIPPGPAGGLLASGSFGESGVFSVPPRLSASSGDWAAEAAKVEDGWTAVKGKKSRPPSHPSQLNLRSSKKGSKSKGKS